MRSDEFIALLSRQADGDGGIERLRRAIPLGQDMAGNVVYSQKQEKTYTVRHTCITGGRRTAFIKRLLITLACLYEREEVNFLIVSPKLEYGELFRMHAMDVTAPFIRSVSDLEQAVNCIKELLSLYATGKGYPRLILVLDGLEELDGCNKNGDLEEYREIFDKIVRQPNIDVITGAELMKSIFSGYPGAFVGVGNCLVTTREDGKADVTYVGEDYSLSLPTAMTYPSEPSITETLIVLNAIDKNAGIDEEGEYE